MKKTLITILCILAMAFTAQAATNVSFQWDANTEADLAGYKIYRSATSGTYLPADKVWEGVDVMATENDVPDGTWFWVATAYDTSGNESGYSNEVTATLDSIAPMPPQNFSIWQKIIAWLKWLFGSNGFRFA